MPSFLSILVSALTSKATPSNNDVFLFGNNSGNEIQKIKYENMYKDIMLKVHPVGSIYESTKSTNPSQLFGGTWESFGAGRVTVGIDSSQTEFNYVSKTGGAKTHTLTKGQLPKVTGSLVAESGAGNSSDGGWGAFRSASGVFSVKTDHEFSMAKADYAGKWPSGIPKGRADFSFGSGQAHNNLQPYIVVYRWRRTA